MEGVPDDQGREARESAETERVVGLVMKAVGGDLRQVAEAMVGRRDDELLGAGEFDLREKMLKAAAHVLEAVVNDRKKGGTEVVARPVPAALATRGLSSGAAKPS